MTFPCSSLTQQWTLSLSRPFLFPQRPSPNAAGSGRPMRSPIYPCLLTTPWPPIRSSRCPLHPTSLQHPLSATFPYSTWKRSILDKQSGKIIREKGAVRGNPLLCLPPLPPANHIRCYLFISCLSKLKTLLKVANNIPNPLHPDLSLCSVKTAFEIACPVLDQPQIGPEINGQKSPTMNQFKHIAFLAVARGLWLSEATEMLDQGLSWGSRSIQDF